MEIEKPPEQKENREFRQLNWRGKFYNQSVQFHTTSKFNASIGSFHNAASILATQLWSSEP